MPQRTLPSGRGVARMDGAGSTAGGWDSDMGNSACSLPPPAPPGQGRAVPKRGGSALRASERSRDHHGLARGIRMRVVAPPPGRQLADEPSSAVLPTPIEGGEAERSALLGVARAAVAVATGAASPVAVDLACRRVPGTRRAAAFVT